MTNKQINFKFLNFKYYKSFAYLLICLFAYLLIFSTSKVRAQASRTFTISPPSIKLSLKPGQKTEKSIKITNNSKETLEFATDTIDFIVTDKAGTPELLPTSIGRDNKYAASTWTTVLPGNLLVEPGKTTLATLYVQIPGDARPGGRYFSVTFRPKTGPAGEESGASVNSVVASLVYLTVEGKVTEMARVTAFAAPAFSEYGPINLKTEILNLSDLHISPRGAIVIKNLFGQKVYSASLGDYNIFPGVSRIYTNTWPQKLLLGRFKADLTGYYGEKNLALAASIVFWVIPYKIISIILLAIVIGVVAFFYFKKQKEEGEEIKD